MLFLKKNGASQFLNFFYVVVVVALGGVVENIEQNFHTKNIDINKLIFSIFIIIFVLVIWRAFTVYSSRYENNSIRHKILTLTLVSFLSIFTIGIWMSTIVNNIKINTLIIILTYTGTLGPMLTIFWINFLASLRAINPYEKNL